MSIFFSYYLIAIIVNFPWLDSHIQVLKRLDIQKMIKIDNHTYLGTYPDKDDLKRYKKNLHIKNIIAVLNPHSIFYKRLIKQEKDICYTLKIKYIVIPIDDNPMNYILIRNIVHNLKGNTLIHRYFFDQKMKIIKNILSNY